MSMHNNIFQSEILSYFSKISAKWLNTRVLSIKKARLSLELITFVEDNILTKLQLLFEMKI